MNASARDFDAQDHAQQDTALGIRGLTKKFGTFQLGPIDLEVPRGYVMGLVGANGSGKTTTIKSALGMVVPDGGELAVPTMDRVGVVLDTPYFMSWWDALAIEKSVRAFYPRWSPERYREVLHRLDVSTDVRVAKMSRGTGMKLQVAVALAHDPELLILDEPTSGLDPLARDDFIDLIAEFMQDETHAVLFSTHITTDLERIADYVTVLDSGRVAASAPTADLLQEYRLVRGGLRDLTDVMRPRLYGLRTHASGFEGLALTSDADTWPGDLVLEPPTLDQIVVGVAKHGRSAGMTSSAGSAGSVMAQEGAS